MDVNGRFQGRNSPWEHTVSIVVPTYGRAAYIRDLITSARNSIPAGAYELIIVSSDPPETEKVKWLSQQADIQLVMADRRNGGRRKRSLYYYTNVGIHHARKEWILVMNDDMVFENDWYCHFANTLAEPKHWNTGMIIVASDLGDASLGCRVARIGRIKKHNSDWKDLYLSDVSLIHREVIERIGYFDENLDWYGSGADNSLAVEFLTDKETVVEARIRIRHVLAEEHRKDNLGDAFFDFIYIKRKWDKWCRRNNCRYEWDCGVAPYRLENRVKYFCHRVLRRFRFFE